MTQDSDRQFPRPMAASGLQPKPTPDTPPHGIQLEKSASHPDGVQLDRKNSASDRS